MATSSSVSEGPGHRHWCRQPGGATVDHRLHLVHRQHETEATDAALAAKGLAQRLTQGQPDVFHRVVIVNVQIAAHFELEPKTCVGRYLIQHVIKEADAGGDLVAAALVEIHRHLNAGLLGVTLHFGHSSFGQQLITDGKPVVILRVVAIPRMPMLSASCRSVCLSPITKELAKSMRPEARYSFTNPR